MEPCTICMEASSESVTCIPLTINSFLKRILNIAYIGYVHIIYTGNSYCYYKIALNGGTTIKVCVRACFKENPSLQISSAIYRQLKKFYLSPNFRMTFFSHLY